MNKHTGPRSWPTAEYLVNEIWHTNWCSDLEPKSLTKTPPRELEKHPGGLMNNWSHQRWWIEQETTIFIHFFIYFFGQCWQYFRTAVWWHVPVKPVSFWSLCSAQNDPCTCPGTHRSLLLKINHLMLSLCRTLSFSCLLGSAEMKWHCRIVQGCRIDRWVCSGVCRVFSSFWY